MALATLSIDLVAQLAKLEQGMDKAARIAERSASQIERKFAGLSKVAAVVGGAIGAAFAGAGLTSLIRNTIDGIDKLNDLSDATGASVENLSALENTAARTGTSIDTVGDALVKLNKFLGEAKAGSEQAEVLKAIGLSAEELKRLDPAEALLRTAQALSGFADDGNKARIVQELFGKSIREVAPLLKDLAEKGTLNATVTKEQAEAAERFNHQMFEAKKNAEDLSRSIVSALLPALNKLFERSKKEGVLAALFTPDEVSQLRQRAESAADDVRKIGAQLDAALFSAGDERLPAGVRSGYQKKAEALREQLRGLQSDAIKASEALKIALGAPPPADGGDALRQQQRDALRRIEGAGGERRSLPPPPGAPKKGPEGPKLDVGPFLPPALAAAIKAIEEADEAKLARLREELAELVRLVTQGVNVPDSVFGKIAKDIAELDPEARKAAEAADKLKKSMDEGRAVFLATRTPAETLAAEIDRLNKLLQAGAVDWDTYGRAVFDAQDAFDSAMKPAIEEVSEFAKEASRNIQDALGSSILASMEGSTKDIGEIWKNMIKRMVAEAAAAKLAEALLGKGFGTTTSQAGGWVGQAWSWVSANWGSTGGSVAGGASGKPAAGNKAAGFTQTVIVQGDVGPKSLKAMRAVQAESEARMMRRGAY